MLKLEEFVRNFEKRSIGMNITSSLKRVTWDCEKGVGTGSKPCSLEPFGSSCAKLGSTLKNPIKSPPVCVL